MSTELDSRPRKITRKTLRARAEQIAAELAQPEKDIIGDYGLKAGGGVGTHVDPKIIEAQLEKAYRAAGIEVI